MADQEIMQQVDDQLAHVWMVRAFLKHSDEAQEDDDLADVHRDLYDYMLALGGPLQAGNAAEYLKTARKKLAKLERATAAFATMQPEISTHTNFQMAVVSLRTAVQRIAALLSTT
jgi:cob(I)alamin adenosyltransferase